VADRGKGLQLADLHLDDLWQQTYFRGDEIYDRLAQADDPESVAWRALREPMADRTRNMGQEG
jgi:hypothetical protein